VPKAGLAITFFNSSKKFLLGVFRDWHIFLTTFKNVLRCNNLTSNRITTRTKKYFLKEEKPKATNLTVDEDIKLKE